MKTKYAIKRYLLAVPVFLSAKDIGIVNALWYKQPNEYHSYDTEEECVKIIDMLPAGIYEIVKIYVK